jgi:hypothetical protein
VVFRNPVGTPDGFVAMISLNRATPDDIAGDPATMAAWRYLQQNAPLRQNELATYFRFWMAKDSYQSVSVIQSQIFVAVVRHYLTEAGLAFTMVPCADPQFWNDVLSYGDLARMPEADFRSDQKQFGVFGHDWRTRPPLMWLDLLGERETQDILAAKPDALTKESIEVLCQQDFAIAVRNAIKNMTQVSNLAANPLVRSRLVIDRTGLESDANARAAALRGLIQEAMEQFRESSRESKFYRVLEGTYVVPSPTQEMAAEALGLPFSTYRRHLKSGIDRVVELLWQLEIKGAF